MKKIISTALIFIMILSAFPLTGLTSFAQTSGDWEYSISNGKAKITKYNGSDTEVTIPSELEGYTVTTIGYYSFFEIETIEKVIVPDTVTAIEYCAFSGCDLLSSITLPDSLQSIAYDTLDDTAYYNDSSNWENGVLYIGKYLIKAKTSITACKIKNDTLIIADMAFSHCSLLESLTIPESVFNTGGYYTFNETDKLNDVKVYYNKKCDYSNIAGKVTDVTIPEGITKIRDRQFTEFTHLKSISLPDSLTLICSEAFLDCSSLSSIVIPDGVTTIEAGAFENCSSLANITIPSGVTLIDDWTFSGCSSLESITIPDSVTSIGEGAFRNCTSLTIYGYTGSAAETYANDNNIPFVALDAPAVNPEDWGYEDYDDGTITLTGYYGLLTDITIPSKLDGKKVISIESFAFHGNKNITSAVIPEGVKDIRDEAFSGCSSLESVTIPKSVSFIGLNAFSGCSSLTAVNISSVESWASINFDCVDDYLMFYTNPLCNAHNLYLNGELVTDLVIDGDIDTIQRITFANCTSIKTVKIKGSVVKIDDFAFRGCSNLTSVTVDSTADSVVLGGGVFYKCSNLTNFNVPFGSTAIKSYEEYDNGYMGTFGRCTALKSVSIPTSVTEIQAAAFYCCDALTDVYYSGTKSAWKAISISDYSEDGTVNDNSALLTATIHCTDGDIKQNSGETECEHKNFAWRTEGQATCTESAEKIKYCTDCGETLDTEIIPATGHKESEWIISKAATFDEEGERIKQCDNCYEILKTETIPKLVKNGWFKENGKWHYYTDNVSVKGWQKIGSKWYYFDKSGEMQTGWQKISKKWYYFGKDGVMVTKWQKISKKWYYFGTDGVMVTKWQQIAKKWYYFGTDGVMVANCSKKIGKKTYKFDKDGVCLNP